MAVIGAHGRATASGLAVALAGTLGLAGCSGGSSGQPTDATLQSAIRLQQQGHLDAAKALYLKVLEKAPRNYFALFDLGSVAQAQNDNAGALSRYDAALAIRPDFVPALYNEATIYATTDAARAIVIYRQVISLGEDNVASSYLNVGFLELEAGKVKAAVQDFAEAVHLQPDLASRMPKRLLGAIRTQARHLGATPTADPAAGE